MPGQGVYLFCIEWAQLDLNTDAERPLQMRRNQPPARDCASQKHLKARELLIFISDVEQEPEFAKRRFANLGTPEHFATIQKQKESLRKRPKPRQNRVLGSVRQNFALVEIALFRNRREQIPDKLRR
jgi:hypothetical protein